MSTAFRFTHESGTFSEYDGNESPPDTITARSAHEGAYGLEMNCSQGATYMGTYKTINSANCYWGGWIQIVAGTVMDQYDEQSVMNFNDGSFGMVMNIRRMAAGRGAPDTWDLGEADRFTTGFAVGVWLYCEFHLRVNSATGVKEAWIDGKPVFSATRDYSSSTALTQYGIMAGSPLGTASGYVYMDTCGISYTERVLPQLPQFRRLENTLTRR